MKLEKISFPVYELLDYKPTVENNLVFYNTELTKNGVTKFICRYVDDRSIPRDTLAERRLYLLGSTTTLFEPRSVVYLIADFLRLAKRNMWFIDNNGEIFTYRKTTCATIRCFKVKQVLPTSNLGCVIEIEGLSIRFRTLASINSIEHKYAGIIYLNRGYLLYGFSSEPFESIRTKI